MGKSNRTREIEPTPEQLERWHVVMQQSGPAYGEALKQLEPTDRKLYLEWKAQLQRQKANSSRGKKAASTRKRRQKQQLKKVSTPEGVRLEQAEAKVKSLGRLYLANVPVSEREWQEAQHELTLAAKAYKLRQAVDNPHPQDVRYNQEQPELDLSSGDDPLEAERSNGLPWIISDYNGKPHIISAARLADDLHNREGRILYLYSTSHMKGGKGWVGGGAHFQMHFPKGNPELSRRVRRLIREIAYGKQQILSLKQLHQLMLEGFRLEQVSTNRLKIKWKVISESTIEPVEPVEQEDDLMGTLK